MADGGLKVAPTLASKKDLAPLTPSEDTSISKSPASAHSPLSASSPAAAFLKMSRNWRRRRRENVRPR